jgi:nucleoside-diphosphate-sugar epimerase
MRYLVTGGAGFIDSNTVEELVQRGHNVVVLDNLSTGRESNLDEVRDKIEFIHGSVTDPETVRAACKGVEYVLHLAARTSVPRSMKEPAETNFVNVDGTLNVLLAARDEKVKRVVFAASSSVYGETPTLPKCESMVPAPISPYGVTKLMGEIYGRLFQRIHGLEFVALRYFNVFGPRQDPDSPYSGVLSRFNAAFLEGRKPTIYGDGQQSPVRPFNQLRPSRPSFLAWPMMGSTTARRFSQRLIFSVTPRFCPVMYTEVWGWPVRRCPLYPWSSATRLGLRPTIFRTSSRASFSV